MSFEPTQFTTFLLCGPFAKPHVVWGLNKHYHLLLETKLGHGTCEIHHIHCACVACTNILGKRGILVYYILNNPSNILLWNTHTGLWWAHTTTGTPLILPIKIHPQKTFIMSIRLYLMELITIQYCLCRQEIMVPLVQYKPQQWANILSNFFPTQWHYRKITPHMVRQLQQVEFTPKLHVS